MIKVALLSRSGRLNGFCVTGHAGFAESGSDIVCASVTAAVQLTANGITECAGVPAEIKVEENLVSLLLPVQCQSEVAFKMLEAFSLEVKLLAEDYNDYVVLTNAEV